MQRTVIWQSRYLSQWSPLARAVTAVWTRLSMTVLIAAMGVTSLLTRTLYSFAVLAVCFSCMTSGVAS